MAKKEKVVELKTKAEKISKEHLKELQDIVSTINQAQLNIGRIEAQKHMALHDMVDANKSITTMQNVLLREYGSFDINLEDGKINWPEENGVEKPKDNEK